MLDWLSSGAVTSWPAGSTAVERPTAAVWDRRHSLIALHLLAARAVGEADLLFTTTCALNRVATTVIHLAARLAEVGTTLRCATRADVASAHLGGQTGATVERDAAAVVNGAAGVMEVGAGFWRAILTYVVEASLPGWASGATGQRDATTVRERAAVGTFRCASRGCAKVARVAGAAGVAHLAVAIVLAASQFAAATIRDGTAYGALGVARRWYARNALVVRAHAAGRTRAAVARRAGDTRIIDSAAFRAQGDAHVGFGGRARARQEATAAIRQLAADAGWIIGALLLGAHFARVRHCIADLSGWTSAAIRRTAAAVCKLAATPVAQHGLACDALVRHAHGARSARRTTADNVLASVKTDATGFGTSADTCGRHTGVRGGVAYLPLRTRPARQRMTTIVINDAADGQGVITSTRHTRSRTTRSIRPAVCY